MEECVRFYGSNVTGFLGIQCDYMRYLYTWLEALHYYAWHQMCHYYTWHHMWHCYTRQPVCNFFLVGLLWRPWCSFCFVSLMRTTSLYMGGWVIIFIDLFIECIVNLQYNLISIVVFTVACALFLKCWVCIYDTQDVINLMYSAWSKFRNNTELLFLDKNEKQIQSLAVTL